MRISRALALAGIDSRRKCEIHVQNGAVTVNGEVVRDLGRQVNPQTDEILFRGRPVLLAEPLYYMLHKPVGYLTTASDPHAKKTVFDLLPSRLVARTARPSESRCRVFPVGRLDKDSSGLLLLTNDGELANHLIHPRYGVDKWYQVRLDKAFNPTHAGVLTRGIRFKDGMLRAQRVVGVSRRILRIMLREGKKREIRRLLGALDYRVFELCRIAFGPLSLGDLRPGEGRFLTRQEIQKLKAHLTPSAAKI